MTDLFLEPVVAHCRMVLLPEDYGGVDPKEQSRKRGKGKGKASEIETDDVQNTKRIALHILDYLGLSLDGVDEVLYGAGDHNDPGVRIDLRGLRKKNYFLIRNRDSEEEENNEDQEKRDEQNEGEQGTLSS